MIKLAKEDKRHHREWFSQWRGPVEMLRQAEQLMADMGNADLFTQGGVDFITEGYAASEFATLRGANAVRLIPERERWPDFQLRVNDHEQRWEFTEVDVPSRRRGDEHREHAKRIDAGGSSVSDDTVDDWIARAEQIPTALCE